MLNKLVPSAVLALLFSEVVAIVCVYLAASHFLIEIDPMVWLLYDDRLLRIGMLAAVLLTTMYLLDLYSEVGKASRLTVLQSFFLVFGVGYLFQALLSYVAPGLVLPRRVMMLGSVASLILLPLWRVVYASLVVQPLAAERLLFLGSSQTARIVLERIRSRPDFGFAPIGFVSDHSPEEDPLPAPLLGPVSSLKEIVAQTRPDRVVVGMTERRATMPVFELLEINFSGVLVEDAATTYERVFQRVHTEHLHPSQLIFSRELGPRPHTVQLQTFYSFLIALFGVVLASPLMLLVAILVRVTSRGPVLYRQVRTGRNGVPFTLFKFRSMRADAEKFTGAVWAVQDDPRITPVGRILRRLRLDELPQFFNVLKGEMSIVGPRPERPEFVSSLSEKIPFYPQRHCVPPGITGWAQINHKYGDTIEDSVVKLEYDLYYIKNLSAMLDFYIIFQTAKVMLLSRGSQ